MSQEMDRVCMTIVIAVAILLLCMGYVEMSQMRRRYEGSASSTCGMKSETLSGNASAKRTMLENKTGKKDTSYMTINEEWPVEDVDCKHKELSQDEDALKALYGEWMADDEATTNFVNASQGLEKAKEKANTRPIDVRTAGRTPLGAKNLGTPGFMTAVRESAGKGVENVKFADSCVDFLQSDSYVQARYDNKKACGM